MRKKAMPMKTDNIEKKHYLGKLNIDWADEIDLTYFDLFTEESKQDLENRLQKLGRSEITLRFGTNEDGEYSGDDLLERIEWIEIPDETTKTFIKKNVCDYDNSLNKILHGLWDGEDYSEDCDDDYYEDENTIDEEEDA